MTWQATSCVKPGGARCCGGSEGKDKADDLDTQPSACQVIATAVREIHCAVAAAEQACPHAPAHRGPPFASRAASCRCLLHHPLIHPSSPSPPSLPPNQHRSQQQAAFASHTPTHRQQYGRSLRRLYGARQAARPIGQARLGYYLLLYTNRFLGVALDDGRDEASSRLQAIAREVKARTFPFLPQFPPSRTT